jgi:hypothetical protein
MVEQSIQIYEPPKGMEIDNRYPNEEQSDMQNMLDGSLPDWKIMSSTGNLAGRKKSIGY